MGTGRFDHGQAVIGGPLEQVAQVVAVGVERPSAVSGEERYGGELGFIGCYGLSRVRQQVGIEGGHGLPPCGWEGQANTDRRRPAWSMTGIDWRRTS